MKNIHVSKILGLEILASELSSIHIFLEIGKRILISIIEKNTHN